MLSCLGIPRQVLGPVRKPPRVVLTVPRKVRSQIPVTTSVCVFSIDNILLHVRPYLNTYLLHTKKNLSKKLHVNCLI